MLANSIAEIITAADRIIHPEHYRLISLWRDLGSPHRPNKEEIEIYRDFLGQITPESRILILGATPELRDLVLSLGAQSFVADYSHQMLAIMQALMNQNLESRETIVEKNWLDMELPKKFFMAILGDLSIRHVDSKRQSLLLERMRRWLKPDGKAILRIHFTNPRHLGQSYAAILDEAWERFHQETSPQMMNILLSQLYDASTRDYTINYRNIKAGIHDYLLKTDIPFLYRVFLYEFLGKKIKLFSKPLTSRTKESYEKLFSDFYTTEKNAHAGNYPESEHYPIYSLLPRK